MVEVASAPCLFPERPFTSDSLTSEDAEGRRPLHRMLARRAERDAARGQRSLEVENQLRESLGIDSLEAAVLAACEGSSASSRASPRAQASPRVGPKESRELRRAAVEKELLGRMGVPVPGPEGCDSRQSAAERSNWRDTGRGGVPLKRPALPPKPKPHRPLHSAEPAPAEASAQPPPQRWKSALSPLWPDRQRPEPCKFGAEQDRQLACVAVPLLETPRPEPRALRHALASPRCGQDGCSSRPTGLVALTSVGEPDPTSVPAAALDLASLQSPHRVPSARLSQGLMGLPSKDCADGADHRVPAASSQAPANVEAATVEVIWIGMRQHPVQQDPPAMQAPDSPPPPAAASADASSLSRTLEPYVGPYELACSLASEEKKVNERAAQLALSAKKLRESAQRVRSENRRCRLFGGPGSSLVTVGEVSVEPPMEVTLQPCKRVDELRRKIAELDERNLQEQERLEQEQRAAEARRREQEAFERDVQERTERDLRLHRECEARKAAERAEWEREALQQREERERRRQDQLEQEMQHSIRRETQRREARSDAAQMKWQTLEEELDRQWAEQEAVERRRLEEYSVVRRKQFQEWEKQLHSERQRYASAAEFRDAAFLQQARQAASSDANFYSHQRSPHAGAGSPEKPRSQKAAATEVRPDPSLCPEERRVLKELQSVVGVPREQQKAKVKELLRRWHPDKNPSCTEKATKVFQFVQRQREAVLGL